MELSVVVVILLLIAYSFSVITKEQRSMTELSQLQYDISTFTAADFTVELNISPAAYEDFLTN